LKPNIVTTIGVPNSKFILKVFAYRKIRPNEINTVAAEWLRLNKRRTFPKSGTGSLITIFGLDGR
jgi:hypothetical protein